VTPDPLNPPPGRAPDTASSRQRSDRGWTWARFWLMTIAALVTVSSTISLGRWQLSRAAQKEALQAEIDGQKLKPPLEQADFLALERPAEMLHRPVHLRGLWLAAQSVYLDNRQMHGVPGFYVLTPLALEGSNQTVMVQRGWIQRNFNDRTQLSAVETPAGLVDVTGLIEPPPGHLLELGKPAAPASAPAGEGSSPIRQNLDLEGFRAETQLPLRTDVSLQQTGPASEGLQRDWPAPALGLEKHYGYAFQWFGLSALVVILYVWFQFIAPLRRSRRARRDAVR
jgi:surfeit locus 1 family protein